MVSLGEVLLIYNGILFVLVFFPIPFVLIPICIMGAIVGNLIILAYYSYVFYKNAKQWYQDQGGAQGLSQKASTGALNAANTATNTVVSTGMNVLYDMLGDS